MISNVSPEDPAEKDWLSRRRRTLYDNFIFDLYGTLVDIYTTEERPSVWKKLSLYYGYQKALYTPKELHDRYHQIVEESLRAKKAEESVRYAHEAYPELKIESVFEKLYIEKGVKPSKELVIHTAQWFRVITTSRLKLYPGAKRLLKDLKDAGKKVYLLSNAQRVFTEYELNTLDIIQYFEGVLISSDEGIRKPDEAFFGLLRERFGVDFSKSIMIGNDSVSDIFGAKKFNMDAMYIRSNISPKDDPTPECEFVLEKMDLEKARKLLIK